MVKVMNVVFGIGIAVILYLVVLLGIRAFYPQPFIEDFNCTSMAPLMDKTLCSNNMTLEECNNLQKVQDSELARKNKDYEECYKKYDDIMTIYGKKVFIITAIIGSLFIVVSYLIFSMVNISAGIALSGLSLIIYGFAMGWRSTDDMLKFIIGIIIAIIVIIFAVLANRRLKDKKKK